MRPADDIIKIPLRQGETIMNEEINNPADVSYIVYEGAQARNERMMKRLIVTLIISVALLFISNLIWLIMWSKQDFIKADGGGVANYIGNDGDIYNGETKPPASDAEK